MNTSIGNGAGEKPPSEGRWAFFRRQWHARSPRQKTVARAVFFMACFGGLIYGVPALPHVFRLALATLFAGVFVAGVLFSIFARIWHLPKRKNGALALAIMIGAGLPMAALLCFCLFEEWKTYVNG